MEIIHCWKKVFSNQTLDVNELKYFLSNRVGFGIYGKMVNGKAWHDIKYASKPDFT